MKRRAFCLMLSFVCLFAFFTGCSGGLIPLRAELSFNAIPTNSEGAVERPGQELSGDVSSNGKIMKVTYSVAGEGDGEDVTAGEARLDSGHWNAGVVQLRPGKNTVTVTAELENGQTEVFTEVYEYDRGYVYEPEERELATDTETGEQYVMNLVDIVFEDSASASRRAEITASVGGTKVAYLNSLDLWQIRVDAESISEINALCKKLSDMDGVESARPEYMADIELNMTTPNDPWGGSDWSEDSPSGNNWGVEAIRALSAWDYSAYYSTVKVGIVDGGFKTNHDDLSGRIFFPNQTLELENDITNAGDSGYYHGSHVAGIIGAIANNNTGLTGVVWNSQLYCADFSPKSGTNDSMTYILNLVTAIVESGAKAVNLSLGLGALEYGTTRSQAIIDYNASCASSTVKNLLDNGYDFVVCQSAGNGFYKQTKAINDQGEEYVVRTDYYSVDSKQNGLFAGITVSPNNTGLSYVNAQKVHNRVIIVGAAEQYNGGYRQCSFSNAGPDVDIAAPGSSIFSCYVSPTASTETGRYALAGGTSMACPFVTGVAALVFAAHPNLTGAQVKAIVCDADNSSSTVEDNPSEFHPLVSSYNMVNAYLSAYEALKTKYGAANYSEVDQYLAIINSLNRNDYINFEIADAAVAKVVYGKYAFEQDEVDEMAAELLSALDRLQPLGPADYSEVDAAISRAGALNRYHYVSMDDVDAAVNAVVRGKMNNEQAEVDAMALSINVAIESLVDSPRLTDAGVSTVRIDDEHSIVYIAPKDLGLCNTLFSVAGDVDTVEFYHINGLRATGSYVLLKYEGETVNRYDIAVLGDVNKDAKANGMDAFLVNLIYEGMATGFSAVQLAAADADLDGEITYSDFLLLEQAGTRTAEVTVPE